MPRLLTAHYLAYDQLPYLPRNEDDDNEKGKLEGRGLEILEG